MGPLLTLRAPRRDTPRAMSRENVEVVQVAYPAYSTKDKPMIEVLADMPAGVTGIRVSGRLSGDDLRAFRPTMDELVNADEIRIVEVIAPDYEGFGPGGLIEDLKLGFGALLHHHSAFKRIAVVSDKDWVIHALHAFAWMIPGEMALFRLDQFEEANAWAAS